MNAQIAEWFGEAPGNSKACALTVDPDHCKIFHADDEAFWKDIWYWQTPEAKCVDGRTDRPVQGLRRRGSRHGRRSRADPSPAERNRWPEPPGSGHRITVPWLRRPPRPRRRRPRPPRAGGGSPAWLAPAAAAPPRAAPGRPARLAGHRLSRLAADPVPQRVLVARRVHRPRRSASSRSTTSSALVDEPALPDGHAADGRDGRGSSP